MPNDFLQYLQTLHPTWYAMPFAAAGGIFAIKKFFNHKTPTAAMTTQHDTSENIPLLTDVIPSSENKDHLEQQMAQLSQLAATQDKEYEKEKDADEIRFHQAFGAMLADKGTDLRQDIMAQSHVSHVWVTYMVRDEQTRIFADDIFELKNAWGTAAAVHELKALLAQKHPSQQTAVISTHPLK